MSEDNQESPEVEVKPPKTFAEALTAIRDSCSALDRYKNRYSALKDLAEGVKQPPILSWRTSDAEGTAILVDIDLERLSKGTLHKLVVESVADVVPALQEELLSLKKVVEEAITILQRDVG